MVISQAWTRDADGHADAYIALSEEFGRFFVGRPGFRARWLVRDADNPTHFTNVRIFDTLADYEAAAALPGYVAHTERMYQHLRPYDSYPRVIGEIVLADGATS